MKFRRVGLAGGVRGAGLSVVRLGAEPGRVVVLLADGVGRGDQ